MLNIYIPEVYLHNFASRVWKLYKFFLFSCCILLVVPGHNQQQQQSSTSLNANAKVPLWLFSILNGCFIRRFPLLPFTAVASRVVRTGSGWQDVRFFIFGIRPVIRFHSPDIRLEKLFKIKNSFDKQNYINK